MNDIMNDIMYLLQWRGVTRAKWSITYCRFLYTCFVSSCIFFVVLCLFQCYRSILEENRKKELKQVENRRNWQILRSWANLGTPVDRYQSMIFGNEQGKWYFFYFSDYVEIGNLVDSVPELLGYVRTSRHSKSFQLRN